MSQVIWKIVIEDNIYPEMLSNCPDSESLENMTKELIGDDIIPVASDGCYNIDFTWYDIGEGESDPTEIILNESECLELFENDKFEDELDKRGILYDIIEEYTEGYYFKELEEYYNEMDIE